MELFQSKKYTFSFLSLCIIYYLLLYFIIIYYCKQQFMN